MENAKTGIRAAAPRPPLRAGKATPRISFAFDIGGTGTQVPRTRRAWPPADLDRALASRRRRAATLRAR